MLRAERMRSLSKIMKQAEDEQVREYDFFAGFMAEKEEHKEEEPLVEAEEETTQEAEIAAAQVLGDAEEKARQILKEAREQAEILRKKAFEEGRKEGEQDGFKAAYEQHKEVMNQELRAYQQRFADALRDVGIQKERILEKNIDDLKNISLSIAEKVIHTSIRSSEEVIKRMILAATEKLKKRQWAKIYITKSNIGVSMEVDSELLDSLSHLSDNVKIITMNNGDDGTCIIELPDEVIDASVGTQLENIKDILNNVRV